MNLDDRNSGPREQVHGGYDLETGLLARVREWTDVFPWIRLGRTLRVAASGPLVLLTSIVFCIWFLGQSRLFEVNNSLFPFRPAAPGPTGAFSQFFVILGSYMQCMIPTSIFDSRDSWFRLLEIGWAVLIWTPLAMLLARQGALLTAGRTMVGIRPAVSHVIRRTPAAWLSAFVPLACVVTVGLLILFVGWIGRIANGIFAIEIVLAVAVAAIAIPCGILAFGANVAVPLSWAALANERDPDSLDSLSRGYEYLYRRPLHLVFYAAISLGILIVVGALASAVGRAAISVATAMLEMSGGSQNVPQVVTAILHYFPVVVVLTLLWSLVGGVYLLLRYDAGGQEVEDLWRTPPPPQPALPEIPRQ